MNRTAQVLICTVLYKSQNNKKVSRLLEPLVPKPQYLTAGRKFSVGAAYIVTKLNLSGITRPHLRLPDCMYPYICFC